MTIWYLVTIVSCLGALRGIVNCAITGEFTLPKFDSAIGVWRLSWIGNILVRAGAAAVFWGMYGTLASYYNHSEIRKIISRLTIADNSQERLTIEIYYVE